MLINSMKPFKLNMNTVLIRQWLITIEKSKLKTEPDALIISNLNRSNRFVDLSSLSVVRKR